MKTFLILHGIHGDSDDNWIPWLKKELETKGYRVITPNLPNSQNPDRFETLRFVEKLMSDVDFAELSIITHSLGAATALDLLEKRREKIDKFISVAGFAVPYGMELNEEFMQAKEVDLEKVKELIGTYTVMTTHM